MEAKRTAFESIVAKKADPKPAEEKAAVPTEVPAPDRDSLRAPFSPDGAQNTHARLILKQRGRFSRHTHRVSLRRFVLKGTLEETHTHECDGFVRVGVTPGTSVSCVLV
jgi:hypothetical protein